MPAPARDAAFSGQYADAHKNNGNQEAEEPNYDLYHG
jgi:hypothetical protein